MLKIICNSCGKEILHGEGVCCVGWMFPDGYAKRKDSMAALGELHFCRKCVVQAMRGGTAGMQGKTGQKSDRGA